MSTFATTREQIQWKSYHETIFIDWADKAACYKWMHNKSYLKYFSRRNMFTIPVIIMSTLTGTASFALERIPEEYRSIVEKAIGSINIFSGIITTVAQFLKLNELTEEHRTAYISWGKFSRNIRVELIKSPDERPDLTYFIKSKREEYDRLMETSPQIDRDIINTFRKKLTSGIDKQDVIRKIKSYDNLAKPEIFNEITSVKEVVFKPELNPDEESGESIPEQLENERDEYKRNRERVSDFIRDFKDKYSRNPSKDEIVSNLEDIPMPDINIIINDVLEY